MAGNRTAQRLFKKLVRFARHRLGYVSYSKISVITENSFIFKKEPNIQRFFQMFFGPIIRPQDAVITFC
ncbi:MAG: hypothetical protein ABF491_14660, partial [Acetobacter sp.]|uniref:hypothetical protein n=1 Tax=Acetobacter sp. TaxID=440 RepID=UPI0039EB7CBF